MSIETPPILRRYLAVSDCVDKPTIFIYDLSTSKRRKTLYCTEVQSKDVVSLSFSSDHKYVLVLGGSPDYTLVVYLWEKGKIVTTLKPNMPNTWAAVNQVSGQVQSYPALSVCESILHTLGSYVCCWFFDGRIICYLL